MIEEKRVGIIACAGMEKAYGSVANQIVFKVVEKLRPNETRLIALPPLLTDVSPYPDLVRELPMLVIDGCAERCATKSVAKAGGRIAGRILVIDSVKKYGLAPDSAASLGPNGEKLAEKIADDAVLLVDEIIRRQEG